MPEVMIARLVLVDPIPDWSRLGEVEAALGELWPGCNIYTGGESQALPVSIGDWEGDEQVQAADIRQFVVRSHVTNAREDAPLSVSGSLPTVAVLLVAYPVPDGRGVVDELSRISAGLAQVWPNCVVVREVIRHPGLPLQATRESQVMQFTISCESGG